MNSYRKTAIVVGVLFITATVTAILSLVSLGTILVPPDYLTKVSANENQVIIGALSFFILAVALAGIAIVMYPIFKKQNEALALGYVGARIVEGVLFIVAILAILTLWTLSQEFVTTGNEEAYSFLTFEAVLIGLRNWTWLLVYIINGIATLLLAYLLYQSKIVPRPISVLGFIGGVVLLLGTALAMMFSHVDVNQGIGMLAVVPGGLFELILPIWLLVKGFDLSGFKSGSVKTDNYEAV